MGRHIIWNEYMEKVNVASEGGMPSLIVLRTSQAFAEDAQGCFTVMRNNVLTAVCDALLQITIRPCGTWDILGSKLLRDSQLSGSLIVLEYKGEAGKTPNGECR